MGMDVNIRIVGKQKKSTNKQSSENWLEDAYQMYIKRLQNSSINAITTWHKNDNDFLVNQKQELNQNNFIIFSDKNKSTNYIGSKNYINLIKQNTEKIGGNIDVNSKPETFDKMLSNMKRKTSSIRSNELHLWFFYENFCQ